MRNSIIDRCVRALVERTGADLRTCDGSSNWRCVQREARGFARLPHLHGLLPRQSMARVVVKQKKIARHGVGKFINKVIHSER